jgi:hypothetical protein
MLTPDLAISGIVSVSLITNVIYKSADFKNYAPSFINTIVLDTMNCTHSYTPVPGTVKLYSCVYSPFGL